MRVLLKTIAAGRISGQPGDVIEVSTKDGAELIAGGYAAGIAEPIQKPRPIETATADPVVEKAVKPKAVRRKRAKK